MRDLNDCKAEVFRRSEKRIRERRRTRNRVLTLCIPLCLIAILFAARQPEALPTDGYQESRGENYGKQENAAHTAIGDNDILDEKVDGDGPTGGDGLSFDDSFSFSLTWGCYGVSSYDSKTGMLVKTTDTTRPEDYVTTYFLTEKQKHQIYDLIMSLDVTSYPDAYDPQKGGVASDPPLTLILSVSTDKIKKTITAKDIALTYESDDPRGQEFLSVCKAIEDILTGTDEWEALPEYENFYD